MPKNFCSVSRVCCPDGAIVLSISVNWFLVWSGLFLIFLFCACQTLIFLSPSFLPTAHFHCLLWPSGPMDHDPMLFTVASPGLAHSLITFSVLHSEPCFRFPSSSIFSAVLSLRDSVEGGQKNTIKEVGGRNPSREEGKQAKYTFQIFPLLAYIYKIHFSNSSLH